MRKVDDGAKNILFRGVICCSGGLYAVQEGYMDVQEEYMLKKIMRFFVATNIIASWPPNRRADRLECRPLVPIFSGGTQTKMYLIMEFSLVLAIIVPIYFSFVFSLFSEKALCRMDKYSRGPVLIFCDVLLYGVCASTIIHKHSNSLSFNHIQ